MIKINKEFLNNYDILQLNTNAKTINEIAMKDSDSYIFTPLPTRDNEVLINSIIRKSKEVNHALLNNWKDKPWSDDEIYNTANSYLTNQFENSKLNIKNEIPITGEENAKFRFSQLLKMYLPILVAHLTLHYKYSEGYRTFIKALSWDNDTIFLPLPVDENGLILWDDIFDKEEEIDDEVEQDPVIYDTELIEELFDKFYDKVEKKINEEMDNLKECMKHIYKLMPRSDVEFSKDMSELVIDKETDAMNEKVNALNAKADILIKDEESKKMNMLKKENEEYAAKISDLEDTISVLKNDKDDLMKITKEKDGAISELKNDIETLEATIDELEEELTEVKNSTSSETEDTSAIIGVKDNEIAELKRELETRKENEQLLRDRNAELEEADNTLRKDLAKATEDNTNLTRKLAEVQNELSDKIDENRKLDRQVVNLKSDNESFIKEIKSLKRDIESLKSQNGNKEIENLMEDNRILRKALDDYKNRENNKQYINKQDQNNQQKVSEKTEEELAREKANRDRIGRMIYGDAYDGTQTF